MGEQRQGKKETQLFKRTKSFPGRRMYSFLVKLFHSGRTILYFLLEKSIFST
jgi:hypothetical protein